MVMLINRAFRMPWLSWSYAHGHNGDSLFCKDTLNFSRCPIDDSSQIQLILSLTETMEELKRSIVEEGEKVGASIKVSDRMEARLSGYMFQITAITSEEQVVSKDQRTEWKWEIHPKEEGEHRLHLTLTTLLEINGNSTRRAIRIFGRYIEVYVTPTQKLEVFLRANWQWLWATILLPVAGWLWRLRRKKQLTNWG